MIKKIVTPLLNKGEINWKLQPDVNILGGGNGSGKTTLLKKIYRNVLMMIETDDTQQDFHLETSSPDFKHVLYMNDQEIPVKRLVDMCFGNEPENSTTVMDLLIKNTIKSLKYGLMNHKWKDVVKKYGLSTKLPENMSAGEKQEYLIYLTAFKTGNEHVLLLIDNMDSQMHIDRKKVLLRNLVDMNPNLQIIIATHSPSIIENGWYRNTKEIGQLITERNTKSK